MLFSVISLAGDFNPQLFRELKSRVKPKSLLITSLASLIGQYLLYLCFVNLLPHNEKHHGYHYSRYCTSGSPCTSDLLGNIQIIKELWWLDLFTTLSVIIVFILPVAGVYLLANDMERENRRQTLHLLRLSPQSAFTIISGKILGVPILVYIFTLLAMPLHLLAGIKAGIPPHLIIAFYIVLAAGCFFLYSAAVLWVLATRNLGNFQTWVISLFTLLFLFITTLAIMNASGFTGNSLDWLLLFSPLLFLPYLVNATFLNPDTVGYLSLDSLRQLQFYGTSLWHQSLFGFIFILLHYAVWSFWVWQAIERSFHNPQDVILSKWDSYLMSACFAFFNLGFTLQQKSFDVFQEVEALTVFLSFNFLYLLIITLASTPQRQILLDWSRFRHENPHHGLNGVSILLFDLILGEKSPAVLCIALNSVIIFLYSLPSFWLYSKYPPLLVFLGFLSIILVILTYATIYQLILMLKTRKRNLIAIALLTSLVFSPQIAMTISPHPTSVAFVWLFSPFSPLVINQLPLSGILGGILTQILLVIGLNYQLKRVLQQAGVSETKALLEST
ncbi:MAG: ABC transporter permease [Geminocystis sp.]|nr:ABC transporter permease [Geminocystis sp.]MCS7148661.1 ABC transporter permease [Geminocystis sp.]MDW8115075.1 ABC transporter permease [Geminocystis sp.]MDW8464341.1 ABC transporter permease [Geminocystis sp.]